MGDRLVNVHLNDFDAEHSCLLLVRGILTLFRSFPRCGRYTYIYYYQGRDQLARSIRSLKQLVSPCFLDKICYTDSEM